VVRRRLRSRRNAHQTAVTSSIEKTTLIVRAAKLHDLPEILGVMRTAPWEKTDYLERALQRSDVIVAEIDGAIAGYLVWNREFFSLPFIWLVTILPKHRHTGIASNLIAWVEERCVGLRIYSSTNASNAAMQRLLEGRGYQRCGEVDVDPGDPEIFYRKVPAK
jgi:GNAT superfamily N-acetyltransferase